jgi:Rad3-related DNA helicase
VAGLIRKILSPFTVAFSATIGNNEIFGLETGIEAPFKSIDSQFPIDNTRIYLPSDTPNLAMNERSRRDLTQTLRKIARACARFKKSGHRCLVVTVSNAERDKFMMMALEEGFQAISYGNGVTAKAAAQDFKDGKGDVLVGTAANYAEGIDLPKQIAPIIFFLRPGYPNPRDPGTQFEERRFGTARWQLWNWRVMLQALQVRGRNIRSKSDVGVTFFMSQQFRRFLHASLPHWLSNAYCGEKPFEDCLADAEKLLGKK